MQRRGRALLLVAVTGALGLLCGVPLLMVMVLMGGATDLDDMCAPGSGSIVLAADAGAAHLDARQRANAATIIDQGIRMGVPQRAMVVALAVAHQESGFRNYANDGRGDDLEASQAGIEASLDLPHEAVGTDHGSLGIFQQQFPWWGTMRELMDPPTAARKFYQRLLSVPVWTQMDYGVAGQAVQHSAYPDAYDDDVPLAMQLLAEAEERSSGIQEASYFGSVPQGDCAATAAWNGERVFPLAPEATYIDLQNWGNAGSHWESTHTGTDLSAACGTTVLAATDGIVTVRTDQDWAGRWLVQISAQRRSVSTWYAHMQSIDVDTGDRVAAGERIGVVGDLGNATGCHLHFEVHPEGDDATADPSAWLTEATHSAAEGAGVSSVADASGGSPVTLVQTRLPDTMRGDPLRRALASVLSRRSDVLVLQGPSGRNVHAAIARARGVWASWSTARETSFVWSADRFALGRHGMVRQDAPWALLESDQGTLPIVSLLNADRDGIATSHLRLLDQLNDAGLPPAVALSSRQRQLEAVDDELKDVGIAAQWAGARCAGATVVPGFALNADYLATGDHGCAAGSGQSFWLEMRPR
ncbi:M23 family metallopeptidase [Nocardioides taihuensis]|uniref:M23 family metallopeptidase n=1 Tax=Nocardioides taihuensis TaxID=1835606 RepID=A0ABW0BEF4_9ACTN